MNLTEDDIYRSSTQFRFWSFTPEALVSLRETTNKAASKRVISAIKRHHVSNDLLVGSSKTTAPTDCLTSAESHALLTHYCRQLHTWSSKLFKLPSNVTATAVQYLRRFYLSNSPMTYHPKSIFPTALFLATKTENNFISLSSYVQLLRDGPVKKITQEDILAPEFILTQGLRFAFDVRHPRRGLSAGLMELLALARAQPAVLHPDHSNPPKLAQQAMLELPLASPYIDKTGKEYRPKATPNVKTLEERVGEANTRARDLLAEAALLTDAYFLYTPSQIWLAAMLHVDEPLTLFYLDAKGLLATSPAASDALKPRLPRILHAIRACATLLGDYSADATPKEELIRIDKKLFQCSNPEKRDLVGLNQALKRNGSAVDDDASDEKLAKKRKLKQARTEDDVFGVPIDGNQNTTKHSDDVF